MTWLALVADVWILSTYGRLVDTGKPMAFHLANAIGCAPLLWVEWSTGAFAVIPITLCFGLIGFMGVVNTIVDRAIHAAIKGIGQ